MFANQNQIWSVMVFTARCYASAGLAMGLCLSVCHKSEFYKNIVDLDNFATASRRYTGDIHNSTIMVCLWYL